MKTFQLTALGLFVLCVPSLALATGPATAPAVTPAAPAIPSAGRAPAHVSQPAYQEALYPQTPSKSPLAAAQKTLGNVAAQGQPVVATGHGAWATARNLEEVPGKTAMSDSHYVGETLPTEVVNGVPTTQLHGGPWVVINRRTGAVSQGATPEAAAQAATGTGTIVIDPVTGTITHLGGSGGIVALTRTSEPGNGAATGETATSRGLKRVVGDDISSAALKTATYLGPTDPNKPLSLSIIPSEKNPVGVASAETLSAITDWATSRGLGAKPQAGGSSVSLTGSVEQIERALHIKFSNYKLGSEAVIPGQVVYAAKTEPRLPASLPVDSIFGLNDIDVARPLAGPASPAGK